MTGLTLATDRSLLELDERYRALFRSQADRVVPLLDGLDDDRWQSPSRNRGWTVQQTMQHVAGVLIENVRVSDGEPPTWSADFDPHRSPQEDIDTRAGESPAATLAGYLDASQRFRAHLAARSDSEQRTRMLWGEPADFRLFFVHLHWDAWVHERDMLVPLGISHQPCEESLRFAMAYAVLFAGVAVRMAAGEIDVALSIPDLGDARLVASADAVRVDVGIDAEGDAHPVSDAASLVDALAGRGEVADVVDAPTDVLAALSLIGDFIHG